MRLSVFSVTPSPYQRDFFAALAAWPGVELSVRYLEGQTPDSPWPAAPLAPYEQVLPGKVWGQGRVRCHWNRLEEDFAGCDAVILNTTLTDATTQWMFHRGLRGTPWFFWGELLRTDASWWKNRLRDALASPLKRAAGIFAVGSRAQADYQRRFPDVPTWNLPYRCNLAPFALQASRRMGRPTPGVTFLYCGQMIARKGVDVLLEAFSEVVKGGHDVRLTLSGREAELPGWMAALDESVRSRVNYCGFTAPADLPELFAGADVFVMPSRHDGWGVVMNQAIGAGLPIIATEAVGAAHDLVRHGVNGLLVPTENVPALAGAMEQLTREPSLRNAMAAKAADMRAWLDPTTGVRELVAALASRPGLADHRVHLP